jgi:hypothetical protein
MLGSVAATGSQACAASVACPACVVYWEIAAAETGTMVADLEAMSLLAHQAGSSTAVIEAPATVEN